MKNISCNNELIYRIIHDEGEIIEGILLSNNESFIEVYKDSNNEILRVENHNELDNELGGYDYNIKEGNDYKFTYLNYQVFNLINQYDYEYLTKHILEQIANNELTIGR